MKLTNLVTIKGYAAGKNGNMLVSLDDKLVQERAYSTAKKDYNIRMLICTAYVEDPESQAELAKHADQYTPTDRVIVISKKFMHLLPKTRLILLMNENAQASIEDEVSSNYEAVSYGHVETIANFGRLRSSLAFNKARKIMERDERKAGAACGRFYKKTAKAVQKQAKDMGVDIDTISDMDEDLGNMSLHDLWEAAEQVAHQAQATDNIVADAVVSDTQEVAADPIKKAVEGLNNLMDNQDVQAAMAEA